MLHFLEVRELLLSRLISKEFSLAIDKYFPYGLQREANLIHKELEQETELNAAFMEIVQTQIPISTNRWLKLELSEALDCPITKKDITNLKAIKKVPADKDVLFAPFCILYKLEGTKVPDPNNQTNTRTVSWHASAIRMLSLANFITIHTSFDRDCLTETAVLEAFEYLNKDELQLDRVTAFNVSLGALVKWCQGAVAYHIITHPYKIRNVQAVAQDSDLYNFATRVDQEMSFFYSFKSFLIKTNKISKTTNYAFNLKHSGLPQKVLHLLKIHLGKNHYDLFTWTCSSRAHLPLSYS